MLADFVAHEASLHRVHPGQAAFVTLEAYPMCGCQDEWSASAFAVARLAPDRPADGKRFRCHCRRRSR